MLPATRGQLIDYCKRKLGFPYLEINVTPDQLEDRLDEALLFYYDYHPDGATRTFYKKQLTAEDISNGYITLPDTIIGVSRILPWDQVGTSVSSGPFTASYQVRLEMLTDLSMTSTSNYFASMKYLDLFDRVFSEVPNINFNRHTDKLYLHENWSEVFSVDNYMIVECYVATDPVTYPDVYKDRWLIQYYTEMIRKQWADNMSLYDNVTLLGGVTINSNEMRQKAEAEIEKLEREIADQNPPLDFVG